MSQFFHLNRAQIREYFQPSKIVLATVEDTKNKRTNIITLAFNMFASYSPVMYAIAIHNINYSYELFKECTDFVVSIPGEELYKEAMFCGTNSGENIDKFSRTGLTALKSEKIKTVGISECIINMECIKTNFIDIGDHAIVTGKVVNMRKDVENDQKNLISIASDISGYNLLIKEGTHRLAVINDYAYNFI